MLSFRCLQEYTSAILEWTENIESSTCALTLNEMFEIVSTFFFTKTNNPIASFQTSSFLKPLLIFLFLFIKSSSIPSIFFSIIQSLFNQYLNLFLNQPILKSPISLKVLLFLSLSDNTGLVIGHLIPKSGSFQIIPLSCSGE